MRKKAALKYFIFGFTAAVLCFIGIDMAVKPFSTPEYCGAKCHEMGPAYSSWELSAHGANDRGIRVECVDCHLPPRDHYFRHLAVKAYSGAKDIYKHTVGEEYDGDVMSRAVLDHLPNERCLYCHDDLLKKSSFAARMAHGILESRPDAPEGRCVRCHQDAGHERNRKLFSQ